MVQNVCGLFHVLLAPLLAVVVGWYAIVLLVATQFPVVVQIARRSKVHDLGDIERG